MSSRRGGEYDKEACRKALDNVTLDKVAWPPSLSKYRGEEMTHINFPSLQPADGPGGGVATGSAHGISYEYRNCIPDSHRLYDNILILKLKVIPHNG